MRLIDICGKVQNMFDRIFGKSSPIDMPAKAEETKKKLETAVNDLSQRAKDVTDMLKPYIMEDDPLKALMEDLRKRKAERDNPQDPV